VAPKPDGKAAKSERITFTRPAAERIAAVVRTVERGNRDTKGNTWGVRLEGGGGAVFHIATFTGGWQINQSRIVTFKYQPTTPNTATALNLFFDYKGNEELRDCSIAKEGTAWFLVDVPLYVATATFSKTASTTKITFLTGASASLNTATCDIVFTPVTATAMVFLIAPVTATINYLTFTPPMP